MPVGSWIGCKLVMISLQEVHVHVHVTIYVYVNSQNLRNLKKRRLKGKTPSVNLNTTASIQYIDLTKLYS